MSEHENLKLMADTIRFLAADMVQQANSGHPGMPMGMADIMAVFSSYYKHNPKNPQWLNRDRVVFSGGHGSALIYSLLHLWGYDLSLDDLKNFRQLGSKTPGHPEYGHTPGIEVTTGPLGQGFANAVGFAMASKYAAQLLNREGAEVITHKTWCFCGDGDLMEGISYEAASLAGHLGLSGLTVIFDSNDITIEGDTSLACSENIEQRFQSMGWETRRIDGHDYVQINEALAAAASGEIKKPLLIVARTKIAKGSATMEGSHHTHGAPLGADEIARSKAACGFEETAFAIPQAALIRFRCAIEKGELYEKQWNKLLLELPFKEQNELLTLLQNPDFSTIDYPVFEVGASVATRDSGSKILNAAAKALPSLFGGSADLAPSNKTELIGMGDFPHGKNVHFGIREHAMGAITNAIAAYGLFVPFCSTFFVFSDYLKPALRVASLMGIRALYIFTHDSIGVGEDGPTHQPIEQLSSLRATPGLYVFRPADAAEHVECFKSALKLDAPSAFVLSRQGLPVFDKSCGLGEAARGGYLVKKTQNPAVTLVATGSEVSLVLEAAKLLEAGGVAVNVASIPCMELFAQQDASYRESILPRSLKTVAVEAASAKEWYRYANEVVCMDSFGASGKDKSLFAHFGFTPQAVAEKAKACLAAS